jgi:hypothetical protein
MVKNYDNQWVMEEQLVTKQQYFCCKFAVINKFDFKDKRWERGVDRIIDMEILPDFSSGQYYQSESTKSCELNLEWEAFYVTFSCSHPIENANDQLILTGSKPEI